MTNGEASADVEAESVCWNKEGSWIKEEQEATNEKHEHLISHPPR